MHIIAQLCPIYRIPAQFNIETAQPLGQLNGTEYFAIVSAREGNGPNRRVRVSERRISVETDTETVWAAVTLQVIDATGAILASADIEACDSATSLEFSLGWWRGISYRGYQPTRCDRAVMAACIKAANVVGQQMARQRAGRRFDPLTGRPLNQQTTPSGWRFDPYTGQPLNTYTAGQPRPAEEFCP